MKKLIPWLTFIVELLVLVGGGYKLVALQSETANQAEQSWTALKNIYQATLEELPPDKSAVLIASTEHLIKAALGTKITYCHAPAKYGYGPATWSIEGLEAIPNIQALYGTIKEQCAKTNIEVRSGNIGALKQIDEKTASLETWFWGFAVILMILKIIDMTSRPRPDLAVQKNYHRKRKRR